MKVFKFGGASIKTASAIQNMVQIVSNHQHEPMVVVVSAIGKSTNALEDLVRASLNGDDYQSKLNSFKKYHTDIVDALGFQLDLESWFNTLQEKLRQATKPEFSEFYDSVVSIGEMISSTIVNQSLAERGIESKWIDARALIKTDDTFQDGKVNWEVTCSTIQQNIGSGIYLTQGFIGSTSDGRTTTLGREGSDFTAAIFASCLEAKNVTIWKDVPGILNADPKIIEDATLFNELSYNEASEMTFYGAKVIHPRTIKPLANKNIPLHVRCFDEPQKPGTIIHNCQMQINLPVIVYKENQCLVSFKAKDLSFVNEQAMSRLFDVFHSLDISIHIMQNSAISFSACLDYNEYKMKQLIEILTDEFFILYNKDLLLVTIKNYDEHSLAKYKPKATVLLEQISRSNYRVLVHGNSQN